MSIIFSSKPITFPKALPNNWHIVDTPWIIDSGKLWSIFKLPNEIKRLKLDVYWGAIMYFRGVCMEQTIM